MRVVRMRCMRRVTRAVKRDFCYVCLDSSKKKKRYAGDLSCTDGEKSFFSLSLLGIQVRWICPGGSHCF